MSSKSSGVGADEAIRFSEVADVVLMRYQLEPEEGLVFVSPSSLPLLGYRPEEFYASPELGLGIVHPEDLERLLREYERDPEATVVGRLIRKDGSVRWFERRQTKIAGGRGRHAFLEATLRDVTAEHELEEALQESQLRFQTAFEHAPIGMALVATDGSWLEVNKAFCDFLGYREDELRQTTWQALTHSDDLAADLASVEATLAGRIDGYTMEKRYLRKDGETVFGRLTVTLVRAPDGTPRYFISQLEDRSPAAATPSPAADGHELTPRQIEILQRLADGRSTTQIAEEFHLSTATVRNHIARLMSNLGVHTRMHAVVVASRLGLIRLPGRVSSP